MSQETDVQEDGTQVLENVTLIDPTTFMALSANLKLNVEGHAPAVMHRQAVLVFQDRKGEQFVIPLSSYAALEVSDQLAQAGMEASTAEDDDLETVELSYRRVAEGSGDDG